MGCGDAAVTRKLRANDSYQVQGLTKDAAKVSEVRDSLYKDGVSGVVAVSEWDGKHLPYIENYVNLLVVEDATSVSKEEIDRVNKKFARVEQVKKFFLLDTQLSAEDEELTPTMKLKRKLVQTKYADQIEQMYR